MKPVVSIVGRPNVGKSTLFNRILGYRKAITEDTPGITRDRNYGEFEYGRKRCILVDTGGFEPAADEGYFPLINRQIGISMDESAAIIFVLDAVDGLLPQDMEITRLLRRYERPLFFVVNKVDSLKREALVNDFYALGVDRLYMVSAAHGIGVYDFLDDLIGELDRQGLFQDDEGDDGESRDSRTESEERKERSDMRVAFTGRPNTGKSSLTNRLLGLERMIVSDVPGTTRDAIDSNLEYKGRKIVLIDTAGLRRKGRISERIEEYSVSSAIKSVERSDVVNLIIDGHEGARHQEAAIAHLVETRGRGLCLVVNKWDLVSRTVSADEYVRLLRERMPNASHAPILFVSALTGQNVEAILDEDLKIFVQFQRRISTGRLNGALEKILARNTIPTHKGREVKIFYGNQAKTEPPTFVFFSNQPQANPEHYKRYLENSLRDVFGFAGVPLRLFFKRK